MDATLLTDAGRPVLRFERALDHPVDKVWRAVTEPDHLARWFPATVTGDRDPGATLTFTFPEDAPGGTGTVTAYDPPRHFAFTWQGEQLAVTLTPSDTGTLLVFTHHFDDRAGAASFAAGWDTCLGALADTLDGLPVADRDWAAAHETYAAAFDLLRGTAEPDGHTWRVRFERQLTAPADQVTPRLPDLLGPGTHTESGYTAHPDPDQTVRVELRPGPGGARLTLVHTGLPETAVVPALIRWHTGIRALAAHLMGTTPGAPDADLESFYRHATGAALP
ncbi:SRPBCC family protein [Actinokineospora enzanensis]|uniref:SRPBCC family protein n=1 Tax=Actinokineospora enzanensis TaxID=155975 RepID=UPI0003684448|nr:SRPBCC family protein [Actinokineospora enzanensis]